jgi:methionyl-tRNA formyltransferase
MAAMPLDLIFMGTPQFAATILDGLIDAGHRIAAVYTQPPRPAGRGHRLQPSPVQRRAEALGLFVRQAASLGVPEVAAEFAALGADAAVVAAYGLILPAAILAAPRLGCLNAHASLLPRWRGAAPIERALLAGDAETGVTIMQMAAGLDTGPILLQERLPIGPAATAAELAAALARIGARLVVAALDGVAAGRLAARPQPEAGVTYARKIVRGEGRLDWREDAGALERRVRALEAFFGLNEERFRVLAAAALPGPAAAPGTVLDDRLAIACGTGALRLLRLQRAGRKPADAAEFLRGFAIPEGTRLPCPVTG